MAVSYSTVSKAWPRRDASSDPADDYSIVSGRCILSHMGWDMEDVALLKKLWVAGKSAAQIARRLGYSRNAVCAKLTRLNLKRGHKPPTAKPAIRPAPKRRLVLAAACPRPAVKKVSPKTEARQPKELTKGQLYVMLAEAVRNTG